MTKTLSLLGLVAALTLVSACANDPGATGPTAGVSPDPWADIDTRYPSEDPVGTVYGYVQAMADADPDAACAFQYRGYTYETHGPCVLADEIPARDRRFTGDDWTRFAEYELGDYDPVEDAAGWKVILPDGSGVTWRIRQDDAGIWYLE
jgi:hypothetical protein